MWRFSPTAKSVLPLLCLLLTCCTEDLPEPEPPEVTYVSVSPGVEVANDQAIVVTFSREMESVSIDVSGTTGDTTLSGTTATWTPSGAMPPGDHTLTITGQDEFDLDLDFAASFTVMAYIQLEDMTLYSGDVITLMAENETYLKRYTSIPDHTGKLHDALLCYKWEPDQWSYFIVEVVDSDKIQLIADNGGYCAVRCCWDKEESLHFIGIEKSYPDERSSFLIKHKGDNRVTLQDPLNGYFLKRYCCYEDMSVIAADKKTEDEFSYFLVEKKE
jgi:hypothetical protein